jgi:dTDP-4-dehydrorhamnose reductase
MAQSFTARKKRALARGSSRRRRILVTGAAGNIGSYFAEHSHRRYDLRLMIRGDEETPEIRKITRLGELVEGDITDMDTMKHLCDGIDTVLHLAADPSPSATWESLLSANIIGAYNTFLAARFAECRRVIYASSIHAVSGYPADVQVKSDEPVNPGDLYGVSKCFGEALARYMAEKEGLSALVLRIGAFQPREAAREEDSLNMLDAWVSRRDLNQLIEKCIDVEDLKFGIFHGLSDNRFKRMDITSARMLLGYAPQDDHTEEHPSVKKLGLRKRVGEHNVRDEGTQSGIRKDLKRRPTKPHPAKRPGKARGRQVA